MSKKRVNLKKLVKSKVGTDMEKSQKMLHKTWKITQQAKSQVRFCREGSGKYVLYTKKSHDKGSGFL